MAKFTGKQDLTEGSIKTKLFRLTLPMMFGILSIVAFNLIDTYFVGKLGKNQLAALSYTFPVIMLIFSIIQGIGIGATALISKSIGKGNLKRAQREATDSLILALLLSGVFVIAGLLTTKSIFQLLGASEAVLPYVVEYMTIWFIAIMFVVVPFVGNSAIRATGDTVTPTLIMLFAVLVNAILDPLLIFGYGPFPEMGLKGAAYATAISRGLTLLLALYILKFKEKLITLRFPGWKVVSDCWKAILYIGLPSGISRTVNPISLAVVTAIVSSFGEDAVAAFGIGTRVEFLAVSVLFALSASIGPFTGQNFGAGQPARVQQGIRLSSGFSLLWGIFTAGILAIFGREIASIFSDNQQVIEHANLFFWIVPIGFGFQGITLVINSNLNTLNKPLPASLLLILQMIVIYIPLAYFGKEIIGLPGVFGALAAAYVLGGSISWFTNKHISTQLFKAQFAHK